MTETISQKLSTIAENVPKVYEAGVEAGKKEIISLHPEKTVRGSYISVDDVSELPHSVKCKVSVVDNPESVTVTRIGKNLATAQQVWAGSDQYLEMVEDGRNTIRFITSKTIQNAFPIFEENTQYTISFECKAVLRNETHTEKKRNNSYIFRGRRHIRSLSRSGTSLPHRQFMQKIRLPYTHPY